MELLCVSFAQLHPPSDPWGQGQNILWNSIVCLSLGHSRLFIEFVPVKDIFDKLSSLSLSGTRDILSSLSLSFLSHEVIFYPIFAMFFYVSAHGFFGFSEVLRHVWDGSFIINLAHFKCHIECFFAVGF